MQITEVQDQAIQARMAGIVGAEIFDRLFAGIRFDEADGPLLYAYARNEEAAAPPPVVCRCGTSPSGRTS